MLNASEMLIEGVDRSCYREKKNMLFRDSDSPPVDLRKIAHSLM